MAAGLDAWLMRRGKEALKALWKLASAEDTTPAQRERILTFFAEMAYGKARTMDATPQAEGDKQKGGVIILPAVMMPDSQPPDYAGYVDI